MNALTYSFCTFAPMGLDFLAPADALVNFEHCPRIAIQQHYRHILQEATKIHAVRALAALFAALQCPPARLCGI